MLLPNLLHPVPIIIQQLDTANTEYDSRHREPIQQSARKTNQIVNGQVNFIKQKEMFITNGGIELKADGYILFRYYDLDSKSITLQINDRISKIGNINTDYYIIKLTPRGHYPEFGGATLVKAYFNDQQPRRQ